jgi:hypothetical protein
MSKDSIGQGSFKYAFLSAGAGALNIFSVLILTKSLSGEALRLDFLYYILSLLAFLMPIFVGPISAGLSKHLKERNLTKELEKKYQMIF